MTALLKTTTLLILFSSLAFYSNLSAQDSTFTKKKLKQDEIDLLLSYYTQDGNHSVVTGGEGTEFMEVFSANLNYSQTVNDKKTYSFHLGTDLVSSASTDRIDFVMSSASRKDLHTTLAVGYSQKLKNPQQQVGGDLLFSIESDYTSVGGELWYSQESKDQSREITGSIQVFFADLRWGRLKQPYIIEAQRLLYPQELRATEWFDIYNRNSYNFSLAWRKDLNKRMNLTFYPTYVYQEGLLSTPFHRVYFTTEILPRVENLPRKRHQLALGTQYNTFISKRFIVRSFYQFYTDDFGLSSHVAKLEAPIKLNAKVSISPFIRCTSQNGSRYFQPFGKHVSSAEFYTSDYDLSSFWSSNIGLNFSFTRRAEFTKKYKARNWSFRYSYYKRSDGLEAHIFSGYLGFGRKRSKHRS